MRFGKRGGIIDHTEKKHRGAVHDFRSPFRYGAHERAIEQLPFGRLHPCRQFPPFIDHIFQHGLLEQAVHFGVDITGVFVGFLLELFRAFLNGIYVCLEVGKLPVGGL